MQGKRRSRIGHSNREAREDGVRKVRDHGDRNRETVHQGVTGAEAMTMAGDDPLITYQAAGNRSVAITGEGWT